MDAISRISQLVEETSRTFALGIRQLPRPLRLSVSIAYLLLRVSDYFEDNEAMEPAAKIRYLNAWADALEEVTHFGGKADDPHGARDGFTGPSDFDDSTSDAQAARESAFILSRFRMLEPSHLEVVGKHVIDSTRGMARWVSTGPLFETEADLDDYMFEVAGRVGLLLTDLFAQWSGSIRLRHAEMSKLGVEFGLGLQTVNVIRGLASDPARGWIFLPKEFLPSGTDPVDLWRDPTSPPALHLLDRLVTKARRHLEAARDYTLGIPRREHGIRVFCILPLLFAVSTVEMSRSNPAVFTSEVKLTRDQVRSIARRTRFLASSNTWLTAAVG